MFCTFVIHMVVWLVVLRYGIEILLNKQWHSRNYSSTVLHHLIRIAHAIALSEVNIEIDLLETQ